jgi:hypothetical protein
VTNVPTGPTRASCRRDQVATMPGAAAAQRTHPPPADKSGSLGQSPRPLLRRDKTPHYLPRDRDTSRGLSFPDRVQVRGVEEVFTASCSPWQIRTLSGSLVQSAAKLDHVVIFNEKRVHRVCAVIFPIITGVERSFH